MRKIILAFAAVATAAFIGPSSTASAAGWSAALDEVSSQTVVRKKVIVRDRVRGRGAVRGRGRGASKTVIIKRGPARRVTKKVIVR